MVPRVKWCDFPKAATMYTFDDLEEMYPEVKVPSQRQLKDDDDICDDTS